jgi:hypothetical protein
MGVMVWFAEPLYFTVAKLVVAFAMAVPVIDKVPAIPVVPALNVFTPALLTVRLL